MKETGRQGEGQRRSNSRGRKNEKSKGGGGEEVEQEEEQKEETHPVSVWFRGENVALGSAGEGLILFKSSRGTLAAKWRLRARGALGTGGSGQV